MEIQERAFEFKREPVGGIYIVRENEKQAIGQLWRAIKQNNADRLEVAELDKDAPARISLEIRFRALYELWRYNKLLMDSFIGTEEQNIGQGAAAQEVFMKLMEDFGIEV